MENLKKTISRRLKNAVQSSIFNMYRMTATELKYAPVPNVVGDDESLLARHNGPWYRSPQDLNRTNAMPQRVLVVGSCLSEEIVTIWRQAAKNNSTNPVDFEFILENHVSDLPEVQEDQIRDYDLIVIQLPLLDILNDFAFFRVSLDNPSALRQFFEETVVKLRLALSAYLKWSREYAIPSIVLGFLPPQANPLGRFQPRYDLSNLVYFVEQLNVEMDRMCNESVNSYFLDFNEFVSTYGKKHFQDDMVWQSTHGSFLSFVQQQGDMERLTYLRPMDEHYTNFYPQMMFWLWTELASMYNTLQGVGQVKVVAVDLDDTLWRGVAVDGRTYDPTGWPAGLVEALLCLKKRGVVLVTVSKNDPALVESVWERLTLNRIKMSDFVMHLINFGNKAENLLEVASTLNVGLDSVVFIDDNPVERELVKQSLPEVRVLGEDPFLLKRILLWSAETQKPKITDESRRKTEMMQALVQRDMSRKTMDRTAFLTSLELNIALKQLSNNDRDEIPRVLELLNKTNQVNTTGKRYMSHEFRKILSSNRITYVARVSDKYTHYGLVAIAIVNGNEMEHFVMSCRVMGLEVERTIIATIFRTLGIDSSQCRVRVVKTDRNSPILNELRRLGWQDDGDGAWTVNRGEAVDLPAHVTVAI